jgi:YVTN family beta-propeller protein
LVSYSLGIDIGTTFVAAALARSGTTQMIPLGNHSVLAPATVFLRGDGTVATGDTVGLPAVCSPDRICRELMSRLGDPAPVILGGQAYELTTVLGLLLHDVVQKVTTTQGESPDHIVLTHPASWGPFRCALFGETARQAGLAKPGLVTEPEAAVAHYTASRPLPDGETVAVYDLGADTISVTVLRKQSSGVQILGEPATFPLLQPTRGLNGRLAQDMMRDPIKSPISALPQTLRSVQVEPAELSAVLLVGGSSHIPLIARTMSDELGYPAVVDSHPHHVVALGAARLAAQTAPRHRPADHPPSPSPAISALRSRAAPPPAPEGVTVPAVTPVTPPRPAPAPPRLPSPPPAPAPPPLESPPPHGRRRQPEDEGSPSASRGPRVLLGTGAAMALTGLIALAVYGGRSDTPTVAPSGTPPAAKPEPAAVAKVTRPTVSATIQMERSPTFVAVSPDGRHAYTANRDAQVVTVLDTGTNQVIATIPIAIGPPQFLTFARDGRTLYISVFNNQRTIHAIGVLDTTSNTMIATIPQQARPYLPAVSPDGTRLYVPNHDIAAVSVIDTATNTVIGEIAVPPNPHWVEFSPDGSRAYTADHESNVVSVIDTATLAVRKTIPVGISPHSVAVNPRRPLVANVNFDSNSVSAIDTTTEQVVATIPVGTNPQDIAWTPDGRFAYVVNQGSNTVSVIDAATNRVTTTLHTGTGPTSIAVQPDGHRAYVSNLDSGTVTVLELPS